MELEIKGGVILSSQTLIPKKRATNPLSPHNERGVHISQLRGEKVVGGGPWTLLLYKGDIARGSNVHYRTRMAGTLKKNLNLKKICTGSRREERSL